MDHMEDATDGPADEVPAGTGTGDEAPAPTGGAAAVDAEGEPLASMREHDGGHPAAPTLRLLGRSHAAAVLFCLVRGERERWRFTELEAALDVSTNTLSKRLTELTEAGLVERESYDEIPPTWSTPPRRRAAPSVPSSSDCASGRGSTAA